MFNSPLTFILFTCVFLAIGCVLYTMLVSLGMMIGTAHVGKKKIKEYCFVLETDLPGKNCGQCGYKSCADYAEALLFEETDCMQCPHCDMEQRAELRDTVTRYWFLVETSNIPLTKRTVKKKK